MDAVVKLTNSNERESERPNIRTNGPMDQLTIRRMDGLMDVKIDIKNFAYRNDIKLVAILGDSCP